MPAVGWFVVVLALAACGRARFEELFDATVVDSDERCGHTFCDFFERNTDVMRGWDGLEVSGGTLQLEGGELVADVVAPSTGIVRLVKMLPQATTSVHLEIDVEFVAGMDGEIDLVQLAWTTPPAGCSRLGFFLIRDRLGPVALQETYNCGGEMNLNDDLTTFPSVAPSGRRHVTIDVTIGPIGVAQVRVDIDGVVDLAKNLDQFPVPASEIELRVGAPGVSMNTAPWTVRYDNLVVDID